MSFIHSLFRHRLALTCWLWAFIALPFIAWGQSAPSLTSARKILIADGQQDIKLVLNGLNEAQLRQLQWNVPQDQLSPLEQIDDHFAIIYFKAPRHKGSPTGFTLTAKVSQELELKTDITIYPNIEILTSEPDFIIGERNSIEIGLAEHDDLFQDLSLRTSLGTLEELPDERWSLTIPEDLKDPSSILLSLHVPSQPSYLLGKRQIQVRTPTFIQGDIEKGAKLYIEMGEQKLGPYPAQDGFPKLDIPSGIKEVHFIAIDEAGNETKVTKTVDTPPAWKGVLVPETFSLPVGEFSNHISILGLDPETSPQQINISAIHGRCTKPEKSSSGKWHFEYFSPEKVDTRTPEDTISLTLKVNGKSSKAQLKLQLLPGLLHKYTSDIIATSKNDDGGIDLAYQLILLDRDELPLEGLDFTLMSPTGDVKDIVESEDGQYTFTLSLPPNVTPDKVQLDLNLKPGFYDVLSSEIKLWQPTGENDDRCLVIVSNDEGHPLGNVDMLIEIEGQPRRVQQTNAMGLLSIPLPDDAHDLLKLIVSFKGFPATQKELVIPRPSLLKPWQNKLGKRSLPQKAKQQVDTSIANNTYPIEVTVPIKDGQVEQIEASKEPAKMILKVKNTQLKADGKANTDVEIQILTDKGLPADSQTPSVDIQQGDVSSISRQGAGRFRFKLTSPQLEENSQVDLVVELKSHSLRAKERIRFVAANAAKTLSAEATPTPESPTEDGAAVDPKGDVPQSSDPIATGEGKTNEGVAETPNTGDGTAEAAQDPSANPDGSQAGNDQATPTEDNPETTTPEGTGETPTEDGTGEASIAWDKPSISVSPNAVIYPETASIEITQLDKDGQAVPDGSELSISHDGKGELSATSVKTSSGKASLSYQSENEAAEVTFTVKSEGGSASAKLTVSPEAPAELAAPSITSDVSEGRLGDKATLSIEQLDINGAAAPDGGKITLKLDGPGSLESSSLSLSGGKASTSYSFEDLDGDITIHAQHEAGSSSVTLKSIARVLSTLELEASKSEMTHADTVTITATIQYDNGDPADDGTQVDFKWNSGSSSAKTSGGKASVEIESEDITETVTIEANSGALNASTSVEQKEEEKPPQSLEFLSKIPKTIRIGEELDLEALAKDKNKDPVKDGKYQIKWSSSQGSFSSSSTDTSSGKSKNTWSTGSSIGSATLEISSGDANETVKIEILAGEVDEDKSKVTITPNPIDGDGKSSAEIQIELRDKYNNLISDEKVDFKITTTAAHVGSLNRKQDTSDGSGLADSTYTAGIGQGQVSFQISPKSNSSINIEASLLQNFYATTLHIEDAATGGSSPKTSLTSSVDTVTLFAISRDDASNVVENPSVDWTLEVIEGNIGSSDLAIASDGQSAAFSAKGAGRCRITIRSKSSDRQLQETNIEIDVAPGEITQYQLSGPSTATTDTAIAVEVKALDAHDNLTTNFSGARNLNFSGLSSQSGSSASVKQGASQANFGSSLSVNFSNGVATVDVSAVKVESATIKVSEGSLSSTQNLDLSVSAGALASFSLQTVQLSGQSGLRLLATAFDAFDNPIDSYKPNQDITFSLVTGTQSGKNIRWFDLPAGGTDLNNGTSTLSAAAFGTFDTQGRLIVGVSNTLSETNIFQIQEGSINARSSSFTWTPQAASTIVYQSKPIDTILQDNTWPSFSIKIIDDFGNLLNNDNGRLISLTKTGGTGSLSNATATTVNGIATFDQVVATSPGSLQFQVTSPNLKSTITWEVEILGGAASSLKWSSQASSATAGSPVSYTIEILNAGSTRVTNYSGTLKLTSSDTGIPSTDVVFTTADAGLKTFNVTYTKAGSQSISLSDASNSAVKIDSSSITVSPGSASQLSFKNIFSSAVVSQTMPSLVVEIQDALGNKVNSTATVSIAKTSGAGSTTGTLSQAAISGTATFNDLQHDSIETIKLSASASGFSTITSPDIAIAAAGLYRFQIETPFTSLSPGQASLVNVIKAVDANGAVVSSYTGTIQFSSSDNTATLPANYSFQNFDGGQVSFTNGVTFNSAGSHTFSVQDTGNASSLSTSSTFTIATTSSKPRSKSGGLIHSWAVSHQRVTKEGLRWQNLQIKAVPVANVAQLFIEVQILSGSSVLWSQKHQGQPQAYRWEWNGQLENGRPIDNGVYRVQLIANDGQDRVSRLETDIEYAGNIDLGQHGP